MSFTAAACWLRPGQVFFDAENDCVRKGGMAYKTGSSIK